MDRETEIQRSPFSYFGEVIQKLLDDRGWDKETLAKGCGVRVEVVESWINNTDYPVANSLARLKGMVDLKPHVRLLADLRKKVKDAAASKVEVSEISGASPTEAVEEIDFSSFGSALTGLRRREDLQVSDVASMCGTTEDRIREIEDGVSSIDGDLYNYLTTLFEELVKAPSPTIMHLQIVRETVTNEPKAEDATARLVAAIKRRAVAERKVKRLEAELLSARQDLEAVTLERNAAQQEIEEAAIAEAGE